MLYNSLYYYYKYIIISRFFDKFYYLIFKDLPFLHFLKIQFNFITLNSFAFFQKSYLINLFFFLEEFTSLKNISMKKKVNYTINLKSTVVLYQYKIRNLLIKNSLFNFLLYFILIIYPLSQRINIRKIIRNFYFNGLLLRISTFLQIPSFAEKSTDLFNNLNINIITSSKNIFITKYFLQNFNLTQKNYKKC